MKTVGYFVGIWFSGWLSGVGQVTYATLVAAVIIVLLTASDNDPFAPA